VNTPRGYLIAGDSLAEGVGAADKLGWAQMIRDATSTKVEIIAAGGLTAAEATDVLRSANLGSYEASCISIGLNDSRHRASFQRTETPPRGFHRDLRTLLHFVSSHSSRTGILSLISVDESRSRPLKEDKHYLNELITQYDHILREAAASCSVDVIDVPDLSKSSLNYMDGVHPSDQGHHLIYQAVSKWFGI
jgi:lysophospholipase L1-like esterase